MSKKLTIVLITLILAIATVWNFYDFVAGPSKLEMDYLSLFINGAAIIVWVRYIVISLKKHVNKKA